jgi:hypothetical protein
MLEMLRCLVVNITVNIHQSRVDLINKQMCLNIHMNIANELYNMLEILIQSVIVAWIGSSLNEIPV